MNKKIFGLKVMLDSEIDDDIAAELACAMERFRHVDEVLVVYQAEEEKIQQEIENKVSEIIEQLQAAIDDKVQEVLGNRS